MGKRGRRLSPARTKFPPASPSPLDVLSRPFQVFILRLPDEILAEIFVCGIASEWADRPLARGRSVLTQAEFPHGTETATVSETETETYVIFPFVTAVPRVCKRWNTVARATPEFWRYPDLVSHPLSSKADRDARTARAESRGFVAARVDVGRSYPDAPHLARHGRFKVHPDFVLDLPAHSLTTVVELDLHFEPHVFNALVDASRSGRVPVMHFPRLHALRLGVGVGRSVFGGTSHVGRESFMRVEPAHRGESEGLFAAPNLRELVLEDPILAWLLVLTFKPSMKAGEMHILEQLTIHSPPFGAERTAAERTIAHAPTRSLCMYIHPRVPLPRTPHPSHARWRIPSKLHSLNINILVGSHAPHAPHAPSKHATRSLHELAYGWCCALLRRLHRTPASAHPREDGIKPDPSDDIVYIRELDISAPGLPADLSLWLALQPADRATVYHNLKTLRLAPFVLPDVQTCSRRDLHIEVNHAFPRLRALVLTAAATDNPDVPCFADLLSALAERLLFIERVQSDEEGLLGGEQGEEDEFQAYYGTFPLLFLRSVRLVTYRWTEPESHALARFLIDRGRLRAQTLDGRVRVRTEGAKTYLALEDVARVLADGAFGVEDLEVELHPLQGWHGSMDNDAEVYLRGKKDLRLVDGEVGSGSGGVLRISWRGEFDPESA